MGDRLPGWQTLWRGWGRCFAGGNGSLCTQSENWLGMRLRNVLRKRARRKGRGRGVDHHRFPKDYFAELGLLSLKARTRMRRANLA